MNKIKPEQLEQVIGKDLGFSDWYQVDQSLINNFAKCTNDEQFIHIDEERSKLESPYGGTIAHGFLSLSYLLSTLPFFQATSEYLLKRLPSL